MARQHHARVDTSATSRAARLALPHVVVVTGSTGAAMASKAFTEDIGRVWSPITSTT